MESACLVAIHQGCYTGQTIQWLNERLDNVATQPPPTLDGLQMPPEQYQFSYDALGRPRSLERKLGAGKNDPFTGKRSAALESFVYDTANNRPDRPHSHTDANGVTQTFTYDLNRLKSIQLSGGGPNFTYTYDADGNLAQLNVQTLRVNYAGWQAGLPGQIIWGDNTQFTVTRDAAGRFTGVEGANVDLRLALTYRAAGTVDNCAGSVLPAALLDSVLRGGPEFSETLTPQYTGSRLVGVSVERRLGPEANHPAPPPAQGEDPPPPPPYRTLNFSETYQHDNQQLLTALSLILHDQTRQDGLPGDFLLRHRIGITAEGPRISEINDYPAQETEPGAGSAATPRGPPNNQTLRYESTNGNLARINADAGDRRRRYGWDGLRRLRAMDIDGHPYVYDYDSHGRRISKCRPCRQCHRTTPRYGETQTKIHSRFKCIRRQTSWTRHKGLV